MSARAMWKARIRFGDHDVPVKWYAAARDHAVRFRMLDEQSGRPVQQKMVGVESGEPVDRERIRRGYAVAPDTYVLLSEEELAELDPEPSREVTVECFVAASALRAPWIDRPYWLAPDGDAEAYHALAAALAERNVCGIARWVMRKRRYVGAVRAEGPYLMVSTLRRLGEVVPVDAIEAPSVSVDDKEAALAEQLVEALADDFDPTVFRDEHRARVAALIEDKVRGKKPKAKKRPRRKKETTSLEDTLQKSLAAAKKTTKRSGGEVG
ncbi:MAG TPA: Ku protein [Sandaracinaceae bacterium LLY-WYZ-13_1]|nr:Ku protein [Sandaracinaceae bacterium LLY-WYZ-13_1]